MKHVKTLPRQGLTAAPNRVTAAPDPNNSLTDGGTLTKPPVSATIKTTPKTLSRRFSDLQHKFFKLQAEFQELKSPARTPEQIERELAGIRRFFATMNDSEGAVTASNMYTPAFFDAELDSKYRVALLVWLTTRFLRAEPLITSAYNFWTLLLEKEGHSV